MAALRKPLQMQAGIPYDQAGVSQQDMGGALPPGAQGSVADPLAPPMGGAMPPAPPPMPAAPPMGPPQGAPPVAPPPPTSTLDTQLPQEALLLLAAKRRLAGV